MMPWFRSKPKKNHSWEALAPSGLYDLHSHVLPGLDDGARDFAETDVMLDALAGFGFVKIAGTPHFDAHSGKPSAIDQQALIEAIEKRRERRGPTITTGAETLFDDIFLKSEKQGLIPGIDKQPVYLIEFGFMPGSFPVGAQDRLFRFQLGGKQLILAHPERIPDFQRSPDLVVTLRHSGVLVQLDVMALAGRYGRAARTTAQKLLDMGAYDLAATDLHRADDIDMLASALSILADGDPIVFEMLCSTHPKHVFAGDIEEINQDA